MVVCSNLLNPLILIIYGWLDAGLFHQYKSWITNKYLPLILLGVAFEQGKILRYPETVPFRLTRDLVDGMGVTGVEGVYRRCCEKTMEVMRGSQEALITILEVGYPVIWLWIGWVVWAWQGWRGGRIPHNRVMDRFGCPDLSCHFFRFSFTTLFTHGPWAQKRKWPFKRWTSQTPQTPPWPQGSQHRVSLRQALTVVAQTRETRWQKERC